ncbi:MAG: sensor histidine kinase, partial [Gammaproteobacteria bacterium]|nr:sensor histidine kinase [Gammaproteobacteria bacterium]
VDPTRMSTVYDRVKSGHYYQVNFDNQEIRSRSLFDEHFPLPEEAEQESGHYVTEGPWQETWLVWRQQITKNDAPIRVWVAEDIGPVDQRLLRYTGYAILLILAATVLLILLQQRTLRHSFEIFEWLRQNLATIRHHETEQAGVQVPREIMPLVDEIEKLVNQLLNRISRTRHAIGNLAHELKRPLQLLSQQQEQASSEGSVNALAEIRSIVERELRRARISGSQSGGVHFDIADELPYLVDVLARIYPQIEIETEIQNETDLASSSLDRDDMLELIGNLLDNACKFARRKARLIVRKTERAFEMTIEDDGAGVRPEQMERLKQRGTRLDESNQGHGLGLGICAEIVEGYQGSIAFAESAAGGLRVIVRIPINE